VTLDLVREWLGGILVLAGGIFVLIGAVGIIRMPDVFTRMHATSVGDTLGGGLILFGLMILAGASLVAVKLLFLFLVLALTNPVAAHALARAARLAGVKPVLADEKEEDRSKP
jgi:multicomponent Na+:H+ antiporter subunit G